MHHTMITEVFEIVIDYSSMFICHTHIECLQWTTGGFDNIRPHPAPMTSLQVIFYLTLISKQLQNLASSMMNVSSKAILDTIQNLMGQRLLCFSNQQGKFRTSKYNLKKCISLSEFEPSLMSNQPNAFLYVEKTTCLMPPFKFKT